jgi:Trk K+ transport system NAD-binding subunit
MVTAINLSNSFIVCGLGSLGQNCVSAIHEFGGSVSAIEQGIPASWEIPELPKLLDNFVIGDCRQADILEKAGIHKCRAILLVTSNERVNLETAFAARSLNPQIRLIVRSAKQNLNDLLTEYLGNFIAFEPTQLPAPAFALAALSDEIMGFFSLDRQLMRVVQEDIDRKHKWCESRMIHELNSRNRRLLDHTSPEDFLENLPKNLQKPDFLFNQLDPDAQDRVIYIELVETELHNRSHPTQKKGLSQRISELTSNLLWANLQNNLVRYRHWLAESRTRMAASLCGLVVIFLVAIGTLLFKFYYPGIGIVDSIYATIALLLSGYGDLFGEIISKDPAPPWLRFFGLILTISGTALLGLLYGLLTESLLSARFQFLSRRPPIPEQDYVILVGLGRVGQGVAKFLQEFKQPLVAIANAEVDPTLLPNIPLISGNINSALEKISLSKAKSLIAVTDDEMLNLELAMMTHAVNPQSHLVIRTFEQGFTKNLAQLLPYADVLCANSISAEAFAAAAYGENVVSLFRLNNQTVLVTEYFIEAGDTLIDLILADVSYGYGVVPVLHQEPNGKAKFMPIDDTRLGVGDRLVVLATIKSLQAIEVGNIITPTWYVHIEQPLSTAAIFEGANVIVRVCNCPMLTARIVMETLPNRLDLPLYKLQAQRLIRELLKAQVSGYIIQAQNSEI